MSEVKRAVEKVNIPNRCKAAVLTDFGKPLEIRDVKIPERLEPGAILVKTEAASVCGSDVHFWEGRFRGLRPIFLPVILGHEMMGSIVKLGEGVTTDSLGQPLNIGDRIVWSHSTCGSCYFCMRKQPNLCMNRKLYGFNNCEEYPYLTGGFAEYCYVYPGSGRIKVPDEVTNEWASSSSCAFRTVVHTFEVAGHLENMDTVLIQGSGPLGLYATSMASKAGVSKVIVIGAPEKRLDVARKWGADYTISIDEVPDPAQRLKRVMDLTNGMGADVVIELSGVAAAFKEGLDLVRTGGRYIVTGQTSISGPLVSIQPAIVMAKNLRILGTRGADISHYYKALQFVKNNKDKFNWDLLISGRYYLDQINEALESMKTLNEIKPVIIPSLSRKGAKSDNV